MEIEEAKKAIRENVKWSTKRPIQSGGQQCGTPSYPIILHSEELDLEIIVGYNRSQLKNKELAWKMFETALNDAFL